VKKYKKRTHITIKTSVLFFVFIIMTSVFSVTYALWSQNLYIDGIVNTGYIDAEITPGDGWDTEPPEKNSSFILSTSSPDGPQILRFEIYNAYPCIDYYQRFIIINTGSIPIHIAPFDINRGTLPNGATLEITDLETIQVHPDESVEGLLHVHLDNDAEQGTQYYFEISIMYHQWNENPPQKINSPPIAENDTYIVYENSIDNECNVLQNDFDIDSDPLIITSVTSPQHGTTTNDAAMIYYTPDDNYTGPDSFLYTIFDGKDGYDTATVNINILPETFENQPPIAVDDQINVSMNSINNVIDVLINDFDPESNPLIIISISAPTHGVASHTTDSVSYTPTTEYNGTDRFDYTIQDIFGATDTASINITILGETTEPPSDPGPSSPKFTSTSKNSPPVADASAGEPYQGHNDSEILFNGSKSYDSDGTIILWQWNFGDGDTGIGETTTHIYTKPGTYKITLHVMDNNGGTNTNYTHCTISEEPNHPPTTPSINGTQNGHQKTNYTYTMKATDPDDDFIRYLIDWGDNNHSTSPYFTSNNTIKTSHQWENPGVYVLIVNAQDIHGAVSEQTQLIILIDVVLVTINDIDHFLIDLDSDGVYDFFKNTDLDLETITQQNQQGHYLIDVDNDGAWDYEYNTETNELKKYESDTTSLLLIDDILIIIVFMVLIGLILTIFFAYAKSKALKIKSK